MEELEIKQATLTEMDDKAQRGLFRVAQAIGDNLQHIEMLKYLEETWNHLYRNTLIVAVQLHAMSARSDEEIVEKLEAMRDIIKGQTTEI